MHDWKRMAHGVWMTGPGHYFNQMEHMPTTYRLLTSTGLTDVHCTITPYIETGGAVQGIELRAEATFPDGIRISHTLNTNQQRMIDSEMRTVWGPNEKDGVSDYNQPGEGRLKNSDHIPLYELWCRDHNDLLPQNIQHLLPTW